MRRAALLASVATSAVVAVFIANSASAADLTEFSWGGFYVGGLFGVTSGSPGSELDYTNDGGEPVVGWVGGEFHGDVYNTIDSLEVTSEKQVTNTPMGALSEWPGSLPDDGARLTGTALAGYSFQEGNIVFGAELRASFGDFGASKSASWTDAVTTSGSVGNDFEGSNALNYTDYGNVLDPPNLLPLFVSTEGVSYAATYNQASEIDAETEIDYLISPVARLGYALDRLQVFFMGGPSVTRVTMKTAARVHEFSTDASTTVENAGSTNFSAEKTYHFSGSDSETKWGYSIGTGAEWAVTDNVSIRAEVEYRSLGTMSVKGKSQDTAASYTIDQDLSSYSVSTGVSLRF
jgi:opacity protein-like surface antigen